jgi:hypothetical protein
MKFKIKNERERQGWIRISLKEKGKGGWKGSNGKRKRVKRRDRREINARHRRKKTPSSSFSYLTFIRSHMNYEV